MPSAPRWLGGMRSLYLRIWLTVVAALVLFALATGWLWQRHIEQERARYESAARERISGWAEVIGRSLPGPQEPRLLQLAGLLEWSSRLRMPLALDDAAGDRIGASPGFPPALATLVDGPDGSVRPAAWSARLADGRTLWFGRRPVRGFGRPPPRDAWAGLPGLGGLAPRHWPHGDAGAPRGSGLRADDFIAPEGQPRPERGPPRVDWRESPALALLNTLGPLVLLPLTLAAVALGAYPVVRRLTRRLESLERGVAAFGEGKLDQRVDASGNDEVAKVAATFNLAADRIETLVDSHKNLLANASHELRSPLARMKMALAMMNDAGPAERGALEAEVHADIAELDALVEEVLLASRLDAGHAVAPPVDLVDLLPVAAEEASRVDAELALSPSQASWLVPGDERLLRRALRNLLQNARRYGGEGAPIELVLQALPDDASGPGWVEMRVLDRGPGVPEEQRERIFEPFYRLPGHAEQAGGVGLGLSLVRQIAQRHGGAARCEARAGGGSAFVLRLPRAARASA